jgi:hypothetical protein
MLHDYRTFLAHELRKARMQLGAAYFVIIGHCSRTSCIPAGGVQLGAAYLGLIGLACNDGAVDGAYRNAGHPIGVDAIFGQRFIDASLVGTQRAPPCKSKATHSKLVGLNLAD